MMMRDLAYLKLLAKEYPTVKEATSEIVNLTAICSLPKGTEYFFSDLHGEYEAFIHLLRSSSGRTYTLLFSAKNARNSSICFARRSRYSWQT